ncbi:MAG: threonine--tRNA ligase [Polyangiaceae bacterium]|nr:threonine--tRNA ligase [Polyangiaceae bacterium]
MSEAQQTAKKTAKERLEERGKVPRDVVAVRAGGHLLDLHTPFDATAEFETVRAADPEGLEVIRHSTAHVMAEAVQRLFPGTQVTIGPAVEDGFYYDFDRPDGPFTDEDLRRIEATMAEIAKADAPFRRVVVGRAEALARFRQLGEHYKVEIIESRPESEELTFYEHGKPGAEWVDFCRGPHVPSTGLLRAVKLTSVAGAYWRGDERNKMLQRIYGTAFATPDALKEHLRLLEEAKKRDHRKLGKELELFFFDEQAPAMPFLLPRGARLLNRLVDFVRAAYDREGYDEVVTPQIFDRKLFAASGHLENYRENMFFGFTEDDLDGLADALATAPAEAQERRAFVRARVSELGRWAQKPMNCPSHCVIFGQRRRSYRELPLRLADFGRLHRYERGGAVHGLARVRSFSQDDAHIFCTPASLEAEMAGFLRLLYDLYNAFDFQRIDVKLATRPEQRLGSDETWDEAEGALERALKAAGLPFEFSPGEGAFYGPKLEFHVRDAIKRSWQLGTLQVDYSMPERFELEYIGEDGRAHRPIMLHRAAYGSLERFLALYIEHVGGAFPTWLSPEQVAVVTVSEKQDDYAREVGAALRARGLRVVEDLSNDKLGAKIRNARLMRTPYIAVVGAKEAENRAVSPRSQREGELGSMNLNAFVERVAAEAQLPSPRAPSVARPAEPPAALPAEPSGALPAEPS